MKKYILIVIALCLYSVALNAQQNLEGLSWRKIAYNMPDSWYGTEQAAQIADKVLIYQTEIGGWPKNTGFHMEVNQEEMDRVRTSGIGATFDNEATIMEMRFLAKVYKYRKEAKYRDSFLKAFHYILKAQYENGGWPQFYPRPKGYYVQITYNDNAMVRVMNQLRGIYEKKAPYTFLPDNICEQARNAFNKGIECILKTQVRQNGELTVWCAQHDRATLEPCKARAYELPSLSGQESDNIVLLLMSLPDPSAEIVKSIEGAIKWFQKSEIKGLQKEYFTNSEGKKDYRMIPCEDCPTLWARFYELETNRPFFCDRDGIKKYDISEIGHERRNGYSWYNKDGSKVLKRYEKWKKEQNK